MELGGQAAPSHRFLTTPILERRGRRRRSLPSTGPGRPAVREPGSLIQGTRSTTPLPPKLTEKVKAMKSETRAGPWSPLVQGPLTTRPGEKVRRKHSQPDALSKGRAKLLTGGNGLRASAARSSNPTVLANVQHQHEKSPGKKPSARSPPLFRFRTERSDPLANDTEFALASTSTGATSTGVWRVAEALEYASSASHRPSFHRSRAFGGVKDRAWGGKVQ